MRSEFEAAGARLTIVAGTDVGAPEFMEEVWQGGELWVDDEEKVTKARAGWRTLTLTTDPSPKSSPKPDANPNLTR
jgi:hypothetical protein|tara:strand:- start:303 stop:530 length:228 start_codon:yes stop_codon:yes gene_type:complete